LTYRKAVSRLLAVVLIVVVLLAAAGAAYLYYGGLPVPSTLTSTTQAAPVFTSTAQGPAQFTFSLEPPFCRAAPGGGTFVHVFVDRSPGFSGAVRVELVNPPSWVIPKPLTLDATDTNATLLIGVGEDAPKTQVTLTVRASAEGSADQAAPLDMKVVAVSLVTSDYGGALVYETTKILDPETLQALTSYSMDKVVFSKMTAQLKSLERGDVMSAPPPASPLVPGGFFLTVLSVHQEGGSVVVETRRASLLEAVQEINVGRPPSASGLAAAGGAGIGPSILEVGKKDVTIPVWEGSIGFDSTNVAADPEVGYVEASAQLTGRVELWMSLVTDLGGIDYAYIHIQVIQSATVALSGAAGSVLHWVDPKLDTIFEQEFHVIPGIFWIEFAGTWEGRASGQLMNDVHGKFTESFTVRVGPTYDEDSNPQLFLYCQYWPADQPCSAGPNLSVEKIWNVVPGSGSNARLGIGPRLQATFNGGLYELAKGYAGGFVSSNLFSEFDSDWERPRPRWWVDGGIDAHYGFIWGFSVLWGLGDWNDEWSASLGDLLRLRLFSEPGVNAPPTVAMSYEDGSTVVLGGIIDPWVMKPFEATPTDPEDGNLCSSTLPKSLVWTVNGIAMDTGCTLSYQFSEGDYHITFCATDSEGATTCATVLLHVVPAPPNNPPTIDSLTSDPPSPQDVNTPIKWKCAASDPEDDPILYQFWLKTGDGPFEIKQPWSWDNYWIWKPTTTGTYRAACWVRDGFHQGPDYADQGVESELYNIRKPPIIQPTAFDFEVSVSPEKVAVYQGETATYTVTVTLKPLAQPQPVMVDFEDNFPCPNCVAVSFGYGIPDPVYTYTLTVQTAKDTPPWIYPVTVVVTGGGVERRVHITLQVLPPMVK